VTSIEGWKCKVCWKLNRPRDQICWKCKTPRGLVDDPEVEQRRKALEARANQPEPVPDLLVALPVWVFRGYGKVWTRGGLGLVGLLALMAFSGVTDLIWFALTAGFAIALVIGGFLAGEIAEGMRNREIWAFATGIGLSVVAVIGSITAFQVFAPGLVSQTAVGWGSLIVFGGAGVAAMAGLVMLFTSRRREQSASPNEAPPGAERAE
jgi:hypothetical protein